VLSLCYHLPDTAKNNKIVSFIVLRFIPNETVTERTMHGSTIPNNIENMSVNRCNSSTLTEEDVKVPTVSSAAVLDSCTSSTTATTSSSSNNILLVAGQAGPNNFAFSPDSTHLSFLLSPPSQMLPINSTTANNNAKPNNIIDSATKTGKTTTTTTTTTTAETKLYAISLRHLKAIEQQLPITNPTIVQQRLMFPLIDLTSTTTKATTSSTAEQLNEDNHQQLEPQQQQQQHQQQQQSPVLLSLEEKLRRERQRIQYSDATADNGLYTYSWSPCGHRWDSSATHPSCILLPLRGNVYVQTVSSSLSSCSSKQTPPHLIYDKTSFPCATPYCDDTSAIDPQISPNGLFCAFVVAGEIYVQRINTSSCTRSSSTSAPQRLTFGSIHTNHKFIQNGIADFLSQEEMDRYRGFWWTPDSQGIFFAQVDESDIPIYRILHPKSTNNIQKPSQNTCTNSNNNHDTSISVISLHSSNDFFQLHQQFYSTNATTNLNDANSSTSSTILSSPTSYEDHRYPFAGCVNPRIRLGYIPLPPCLLLGSDYEEDITYFHHRPCDSNSKLDEPPLRTDSLYSHFCLNCLWYEPPKEVCEYLTRLYFLPDGSAVAQWQNRQQNLVLGIRIPYKQQQQPQHVLWEECTKDRPNHQWVNLHSLYQPLKLVYYHNFILPSYGTAGAGASTSFSFLLGSEQSGFLHLYLYTYTELNYDRKTLLHGKPSTGNRAQLIRAVSSGPWIVEDIAGVNEAENVVYVTGTFHSPLERHLYALPLMAVTSYASSNPTCLTIDDKGMHTITMDARCQYVVDASSDLNRPPSIKVYSLHVPSWWPDVGFHNNNNNRQISTGTVATQSNNASKEWLTLLFVLHDSFQEPILETALYGHRNSLPQSSLCSRSSNKKPQEQLRFTPPQLISFPSSDGSVELHAAVYLPDPTVHGPGPYPLACAVYGGPHVQRVNRSYNQCLDMRAQRLKSLGFAVMKCDNRGSARRGVAFENPISRRLGQVEVEDQITAVQYVVQCGVADPQRIGIYGWSYGGYLAALCLCRAPHIFRVAVAGAPVTSWDGYDTHYTERYMGLPQENREQYKSSALIDAVSHMQVHQKLMIVHGLIDENVHFRHTERLVHHLIALGKEYDLLLFPEERHSPRRLRDRVYMEQQISSYFVRHLMNAVPSDSSRGEGSKKTSTRTVANWNTNALSRFPKAASVIQRLKCTGSDKVGERTTNCNTSMNEHTASSTGATVPSGSSSDYLRPIIRGHL
jgi:alpha/beta superfamily hydrolase